MTAFYLRLDGSDVVRGTASSPDPQPDGIIADHGLVAVDQSTHSAASGQIGTCRYVDGALQPYAPAPIAPYTSGPRTASAKQVRYALNDLGVRSAWNAAATASSQGAQDYWTSADPMAEDNAKVAKWCAAAGVMPKALFDKAVTE